MTDSYVQQGFCRNCGEQGRVGAAFCVSCGGALSTPQQNADHEPQSASDTAGDERPDMKQDRQEVTETILAFVFAESWEERKRTVEERQDLLLTDAADEELAALITVNEDNEDTVDALEEHRKLLARCRQKGIDAAFAEDLQPSPDTREDQATDAERNEVLDAVADFVNIRPWVASKLVLKQRQDLLLTDTADEVLSTLVVQRYKNGEAENARVLEEHRQLLARCREKGIDAAFTERSQKKQPFWEWVCEWLIVIVILILFLIVVGLFI